MRLRACRVSSEESEEPEGFATDHKRASQRLDVFPSQQFLRFSELMSDLRAFIVGVTI